MPIRMPRQAPPGFPDPGLQSDDLLKVVRIDYTNYRGERKEYLILPSVMWYGVTAYHTQPQWILTAKDVTRDATRDFAVKDIHSWTPAHRCCDASASARLEQHDPQSA